MNAPIGFEAALDSLRVKLRQVETDATLTEPQIAVLRAAWENLGFDELEAYYPYKAGYLRRIASLLWIRLTKVYGKEIKKRNLREIIINNHKDHLGESLIDKVSLDGYGVFGDPPMFGGFYGRQNELRLMSKSITNIKCMYLFGYKGIGKTSLASRFFQQIKLVRTFDKYIWHYSNSKKITEDIDEVLCSVLGKNVSNPEKDFFDYLKQHRVLIVIDGIESWLANLPEIEKFLKKVSESVHQSVLILTCAEPIPYLQDLENTHRPILNIHVEGLKNNESSKIVQEYNLFSENIEEFISSFQGNPYLIHKACIKTKTVFNSKIEDFPFKTSFAGLQLRSNHDAILSSPRIREIDKFVLSYLAQIENSLPILLKALVSNLERKSSYSASEVEDSIEVLRNNSLLNYVNENGSIFVAVPRYFIKYIKENLDCCSPQAERKRAS